MAHTELAGWRRGPRSSRQSEQHGQRAADTTQQSMPGDHSLEKQIQGGRGRDEDGMKVTGSGGTDEGLLHRSPKPFCLR